MLLFFYVTSIEMYLRKHYGIYDIEEFGWILGVRIVYFLNVLQVVILVFATG